MFWNKKPESPRSPKAAGAFVSYDIEYVYDFLGKERIDKKIVELEDQPTMGITFSEFVNRDTIYLDGTGPLYIFDMLLRYFDKDVNLTLFLLQESKRYKEPNYYSTKNMNANWTSHLKSMDYMIERGGEFTETYKDQKTSNYWKEYHFFTDSVLAILMNEGSYSQKIEELIEDYKTNIHSIGKRFETDTYDPFNNGFVWRVMTHYDEDNSKANQLIELNNLYPNAWHEIDLVYEDEEEDEEE